MNLDEVIEEISKPSKKKRGLVCLNCMLFQLSLDNLVEMCRKAEVLDFDSANMTQESCILALYRHFYDKYRLNLKIQNQFGYPASYLGEEIVKLMEHNLQWRIGLQIHSKFDFYSKTELKQIFADFCADLGITTYEVEDTDSSIDLYLTKKDPFLKTEAVFVRTGFELEKIFGEKLLQQIAQANQIADWIVFVTTPHGVLEVGLNRLVNYLENINVWLYVVDPFRKEVFGITKGKKSKDKVDQKQEEIIASLPEQPLRAPSDLKKFSKYQFSEKDSYKSSKFLLYEVTPESIEYAKNYREPVSPLNAVFRALILVDLETNINISEFSNPEKNVEEGLITAFLSAMDSFISEVTGGGEMQEIDYKGMSVTSHTGDKIKTILLLEKPANQITKDRMAHFTRFFEEIYQQEIENYRKTGDCTYFEAETVRFIAYEILRL